MFTVNKNPSEADLRKFGWAMLIGFGVIGMVLWIVSSVKARDSVFPIEFGGGHQIAALCLWALGAGLFALSFLSPVLAKPVYVAWMTAATAIGMVMSTVLLTVLFVVLLPIFSIVVRLGDPLRKRLTGGGTYWEDYKPHEATIERMKRPF